MFTDLIEFIFSPAAVFYVAAASLIASASAVVTVRHPVRAVLFLVACFFSSAVLWLLLEAEFLAIALVLVYVGAVMVLFLFVVMMLDIDVARIREGFARVLPIGLIVAAVIGVQLVLVAMAGRYDGSEIMAGGARPAGYSNTESLGILLYTEYVYPFEIAALVLLVAIVSAITLTLRKRPETRYQAPHRQIQVQASERLRVVDLKGNRPEQPS